MLFLFELCSEYILMMVVIMYFKFEPLLSITLNKLYVFCTVMEF